MKYRHSVHVKTLVAAAFLAGAATLPSCDNVIFDSEGDCSSHFYATFRYDANVLQSDAFGRQVTGVALYVFDQTGTLVGEYHHDRQPSADNNYRIPLDLPPGTYDMLAWCTGTPADEQPIAFAVNESHNPSAMSALSAAHPLENAPDGALYAGHDIVPLFHGISRGVVFPDKPGDIDVEPIYLTKDTNRINISLVNMSGQAMDPDDYTVELTGRHSQLDHLNNLVEDSPEHLYRTWAKLPLRVETGEGRAEGDGEAVNNGMLARLTVGRLMTDKDHRLTVRRNDTGETVISMPVMSAMLQAMDLYPSMKTPQQYLDCVDAYNFELFLDPDGEWIKTRIFINGWRVVPDQTEDV